MLYLKLNAVFEIYKHVAFLIFNEQRFEEKQKNNKLKQNEPKITIEKIYYIQLNINLTNTFKRFCETSIIFSLSKLNHAFSRIA